MSDTQSADPSVFTQPDALPHRSWTCQHCRAANPPATPRCQDCATDWLRICPECADLGRSILKRGTTNTRISARHTPIVTGDTGRCGLCGYAIAVAAQRVDLRQRIALAEQQVSRLAEQQRRLDARPNGWKGVIADGRTALFFAAVAVLLVVSAFNDVYAFWFRYDPLMERISATAITVALAAVICLLGAVIGFGLTRIRRARQRTRVPQQLAAAQSALHALKDALQSTTI